MPLLGALEETGSVVPGIVVTDTLVFVPDMTLLEEVDPPNGFVFDPQCARELSLALLTIESMPVHSAMGQAGRRIVQKFSCDNFSKNALLAARVAVGELPVQQPVQAPIPEMDIARS